MAGVTGLHHITVIAGDPQENLDFYNGLLGMRLVKRSVNQDVPDTYHLFYADGAGSPGTDLTFFPWPAMAPGHKGVGLAVEVSLAVPMGSLGFWADRLKQAGTVAGEVTRRFGESLLPLTDPHGLNLALVEIPEGRAFTPWQEGPVAPAQQVRGLHAVRLRERSLGPTATFLTAGMGFEKLAEEDGWHRFGPKGGGSGCLVEIEEVSDRRGQWGPGIVHHVAWRVPDDAAELTARGQVYAAGAVPTEVIDRFWFKSVYFREPGGVLFEIATDGPGFAIDEAEATLGEHLVLPPWLESGRKEIERRLQPLRMPLR